MIRSRKARVPIILALFGFPFLTFLNLPRVDEKGRLWREPLRINVVSEVEGAVPSSTTVVVSEVKRAVPSSTTVIEEKSDEIETDSESRSPGSQEEALIEDEVTKPHIWDEVYLPSWPSIDMWDELASCESGQNWEIDTGNGYFGGLQFSLSTWRYVGGLASPSASSRMEQIYRANLLWETQGWQPWPGCRSKFGWSRWQVIS
ncbi:MAG: transglycosylase family protein [Actinomycetota bacterium]|nr:transglycosylase family protein [Actinomycetota bacterium]